LVIALAAIVSAGPAVAASPPGSPPDLRTPGNTFTSSSHYVSATVFPWYTTAGGHQIDGPWRPLEGRAAWTGEPDFWEDQIKQMMTANIDVMLVELFPVWTGFDKQRVNLFQAMGNLRAQGYNVPKAAPFLDTLITTGVGWTNGALGEGVNLATTAGKDLFVNQYNYFYTQYYAVNTDYEADSYIAQIDGRVVLDSYILNSSTVTNVSSLTREDVQSRLVGALGSESALFRDLPANGVFMIDSVAGSHYSFEDERLAQFETASAHYIPSTSATGRQAAHVMPGYWDANIRNPENAFLARNGGAGYRSAWTSVQNARAGGLRHVNVESWNEYDEGSGIYAGDPGAPYIKPGSGNTHTDTWSDTNDPYEYIKTTAEGARQFNDTVDRDATILWNNFPTTMQPGETGTYQVIVRNDGDLSWTGAAEFKFGENESVDPVLFSSRTLIDDATNEIPTYGGIFRGRPITFDVELTAPMTAGVYMTHWSMTQEGVAWFGDELSLAITVALAGDYNGNGTVDAADYTVWRNNVGSSTTLPNDPIGGVIGQDQYDQWKANFGMTAGSGSAATGAPVPEPSILAILATGILVIFSWSRVARRVAKSENIVMVAFFLCAAGTAQAGSIHGPQIFGVTVASNKVPDDGNALVANLVNNSGMSGDYQDAVGAAAYWRQVVAGGVNAQVTFDLGYLPSPCHYNVNAIKIWNYLEPGEMDRGVKDITLWGSANGTSYTQIGSIYTLTQNSNYGGDPSGVRDLIPLGGVNARYIRLDVLSSYGDPTWYGLGEVRFFGVDSDAPMGNSQSELQYAGVDLVPEPSTLALLTCGLSGLLACVWWKRI
jgi:hypothetical protein